MKISNVEFATYEEAYAAFKLFPLCGECQHAVKLHAYNPTGKEDTRYLLLCDTINYIPPILEGLPFISVPLEREGKPVKTPEGIIRTSTRVHTGIRSLAVATSIHGYKVDSPLTIVDSYRPGYVQTGRVTKRLRTTAEFVYTNFESTTIHTCSLEFGWILPIKRNPREDQTDYEPGQRYYR